MGSSRKACIMQLPLQLIRPINLDSISVSETEVRAPEILNSTLSSKKIFDTFGIKQKSWHGQLQTVIKLLYEGRPRAKDFDLGVKPNEIDQEEILIQ